MKSIRFWREFPRVCVLSMGAGLATAAVVTLLSREIYESEAIIEVRPLGSDSETLKGDGSPEYLMKAAEALRGRELLGKVVKVLQLDRKWKKERNLAVEDLREAVSTRLLGDSSRVLIRVCDADSQDACAIATEIGWYFRELRNGLARSELRQRLDQADQAIRNQEDRVEERRKVLRTILRRSLEVDPGKVEWLKSDGSDTNEESLGDFMKRALEPGTYEDAKRNLDAELNVLSELSAKRAVIQADGGAASETVIYHEMPRIEDSPVWPDVPFNLGLGMGIGFLSSPFLTRWLIRKRA